MAHSAWAKNILILGDSLSAGYGLRTEQGWVALLAEKLKQHAPHYQVVNDSISGDTSSGGLARINKLLDRHKPKILVIELGANDGLRGLPPKNLYDNLSKIIKAGREHNAEILLLGIRIPPNYGKPYTDKIYEVYPQLAAEFKVKWLPFIVEDIFLDPALIQVDGLHPNSVAQPKLLDKVWPVLQTIIR